MLLLGFQFEVLDLVADLETTVLIIPVQLSRDKSKECVSCGNVDARCTRDEKLEKRVLQTT